MLISAKGRYALRLMVCMAQVGEGAKLSLREVSQQEAISFKYLEQLVRPLMREQLLFGVRGKGGGYTLAKRPDEIRAGDVLRAVEGSTIPVACLGISEDELCPRSTHCSTVRFWAGLEEVIESFVDSVTLADLAETPSLSLKASD